MLDVIVVITAQLLDLTRHDNDSAAFVLLLAYHIGFWTWKGTTVGGIICQLRVVRVDGAPLRCRRISTIGSGAGGISSASTSTRPVATRPM